MNDYSNLSSCLEIIYDPQSSALNRTEAHRVLESFEARFYETPTIFFEMAQTSNPLPLRHFGLHLLENYVKFHFTDDVPKRAEVLRKLLQFIKINCTNILTENTLIKESLVRCLTEITKSEWPQRWPNFYSDCQSLILSGFCQCQIILLSWNRLIEDVIIYQNFESITRRRDLHNCLMTYGGQLLSVGADVLKETYKNLQQADDESQLKLCTTALEFLSNCVEWVPIGDLKPHLVSVLDIFCHLLTCKSKEMQNFAANCLHQIALRKSEKKADFPFVLLLFEETVMHLIVSAVELTVSVKFDEQQYNYLKNLGSLFVALGLSLSQVWNTTLNENDSNLLKGVELFVNAVFGFLQHPSLVVRYNAAAVFQAFFKNEFILNSTNFNQIQWIPKFLNIIPIVIQSQGFPSKNEPPYSDYSQLDFDTDLDFSQEFSKFRELCLQLLRKTVQLDYKMAYQIVFTFITTKLDGNNLHNLSNLEWEAMVRVINNTIMAMQKHNYLDCEEIRHDSKRVLDILYNMFDFDNFQLSTADLILSTWSTLFPLLQNCTDYVLPFVSRLFQVALIKDESDVGRKIRHHAMHDFVHLAVDQSKLISAYVDEIIKEMEKYENVLTLRQKCSLAEALIVLGNEFANYEKQKALIEYLVGGTVQYFTSVEVVEFSSSPQKFAEYVGLFEEAPDVVKNDDLYFGRRKEISSNLLMLGGVINRLIIPNKLEVLKLGGYVDETSGKVHHPMFPSVQPILSCLFALARCVNGLYNSSVVQNVHKSYDALKVLDLTDSEKNFNLNSVLMAAHQTQDEQRPVEHMKLFISETTEKM